MVKYNADYLKSSNVVIESRWPSVSLPNMLNTPHVPFLINSKYMRICLLKSQHMQLSYHRWTRSAVQKTHQKNKTLRLSRNSLPPLQISPMYFKQWPFSNVFHFIKQSQQVSGLKCLRLFLALSAWQMKRSLDNYCFQDRERANRICHCHFVRLRAD